MARNSLLRAKIWLNKPPEVSVSFFLFRGTSHKIFETVSRLILNQVVVSISAPEIFANYSYYLYAGRLAVYILSTSYQSTLVEQMTSVASSGLGIFFHKSLFSFFNSRKCVQLSDGSYRFKLSLLNNSCLFDTDPSSSIHTCMYVLRCSKSQITRILAGFLSVFASP